MRRQVGIWLFIFASVPVAGDVYAQVTAAQATPSAQAVQKDPKVQEPLAIKLVRAKVVVEGGKEIRRSAPSAKPGEILEEVATYTNTSNSTLTSLVATLPVPANTELVITSIKPDTAQASIDGQSFLPLPLKRKVKQADGVESEQLVPVTEYKFLRWHAGALRPSSSLVFSARFKVSDDSPAISAGNVKPNGKQ